jgi:hypothetical protein
MVRRQRLAASSAKANLSAASFSNARSSTRAPVARGRMVMAASFWSAISTSTARSIIGRSIDSSGRFHRASPRPQISSTDSCPPDCRSRWAISNKR